MSDNTCFICESPIEYYAIGECDCEYKNKAVCALCVVRLRCVMKDKNCPFCRVLYIYYLCYRE